MLNSDVLGVDSSTPESRHQRLVQFARLIVDGPTPLTRPAHHLSDFDVLA